MNNANFPKRYFLSLAAVFLMIVLALSGCAKHSPQTDPAATVEKRPQPGETAHRAEQPVDTSVADVFFAKPDELVFMNETIHKLSGEDATALYHAILQVTEIYPREVARLQYTPESAERDFAQMGALELRYHRKHLYTIGTGDEKKPVEIDGFWIFLNSDRPMLVALAEGKPCGSFLLFGPTTEEEPQEAIAAYRETVRTVLQKNGLLTPEWQK